MQAQAKENWHNIEQLLGPYYDEVNDKDLFKGSVIDDEKLVEFYNFHDGKMLYMLTQHSLWSQKHHPFISCKCRKGDSVQNGKDHVCSMMTNEEYKRLHQRSEEAFNARK